MKKIVYFFPNESSFIKRDIVILSEKYKVRHFSLHQGDKLKLPFQLLKQFFQAVSTIPTADVVICHFAGYSSLIPNIIGRIFRKPRLLIIAGTDAASFPEVNYGSFNRNKLMEWFTKKSMKNATHLLPVHERLAFQEYNYHPYGGKVQGFHYFYPPSKNKPFSPLYYSYQSDFFTIDKSIERRKNSFISIGNLSIATTFQRKGFDLIIALANKHPELEFTLIGWDGKMQFDFPTNVRLLPFLSQSEIVKELNAHEFYFQLSLMEGFPNALAEAMLCGCVPIGSNVSGIPFIIGDTGFVLEHHDLTELEALIKQILSEDNREMRSSNARKRIVENFNDTIKLNEFVRIIDLYTSK